MAWHHPIVERLAIEDSPNNAVNCVIVRARLRHDLTQLRLIARLYTATERVCHQALGKGTGKLLFARHKYILQAKETFKFSAIGHGGFHINRATGIQQAETPHCIVVLQRQTERVHLDVAGGSRPDLHGAAPVVRAR